MRKVLILQQGAHRGEVVCQGKGCFAVAKPKPKQEDLSGSQRRRQTFAEAKLPFAEAKEGHNKRQLSGSPWRRMSNWNNKPHIFCNTPKYTLKVL